MAGFWPKRAVALVGGDVAALRRAGARRSGASSQWSLARRRPAAVEDHAGADRAVGQAVDDDERAGRAIAAVGVEADRLAERDRAAADLVQLQRRRHPCGAAC